MLDDNTEAATNTTTPAIEASPNVSSSSRKTTTTRRSFPTNNNDEEFHNIKTIAATIVRAQKKQVVAMQHHRQDVDRKLQESQAIHTQERIHQLSELESMQKKHFQSQLIALDMKEKRIMARVKRMEARIQKTMELSKQVREVKERRQEVAMERVEFGVNRVRGTLDSFQSRTEKRLEIAELRLEQEARVNDYFRNDTRLQLDQLDFRASALHGWSSAAVAEEMTPVVYATPYVVEDEDEEEMDSVVPLFPEPFRETKNGGRHKRSYPKRKKRRHLLGTLNF